MTSAHGSPRAISWADAIRVIRDFETQESKGYAFVEAPNEEEMHAIIRRFNRAPIDGKLLRAKAAHPKGEKTRPAARRPKRRTDGAREGQRRQGSRDLGRGAAESSVTLDRTSTGLAASVWARLFVF